MTHKEFEESMTPEELAYESWFDLSDERLGQLVRANCHTLTTKDEDTQFRGLIDYSAALMLIKKAQTTNADVLTLELSLTSNKTGEKQKWEIRTKKID